MKKFYLSVCKYSNFPNNHQIITRNIRFLHQNMGNPLQPSHDVRISWLVDNASLAPEAGTAATLSAHPCVCLSACRSPFLRHSIYQSNGHYIPCSALQPPFRSCPCVLLHLYILHNGNLFSCSLFHDATYLCPPPWYACQQACPSNG